MNENGTHERVCGQCRHWHRHPLDARNLSDVRGDCRESPPNATSFPQPNGTTVTSSSYPNLPKAFPACSRYSEVVLTIAGV